MFDCNFNYGQSTDRCTNEEKLVDFRNSVLAQMEYVPIKLNMADVPDLWAPDEEFFEKMKVKKC